MLPDLYCGSRMVSAWKHSADIRRFNVRLLVEQHGAAELCTRLNIAPQMLSQYIGRNPIREFGPSLARRIEREFHLDPNWLDSLHVENRSDIQMLIDAVKGLPPHRVQLLLQMALALQNHEVPSKRGGRKG